MSTSRDPLLADLDETWLVTGVAGFVGSHLLHELLRSGQRVVGLDDLSTGSRRNLDAVRGALDPTAWNRFTFLHGDIRDVEVCRTAMNGATFVLHQAALGSVPRSLEYPAEAHSVNVDGTVNIFLAALTEGVRKVVYASSSSVYGDEPTLPKREDRIGAPLSPYAATKRIGELYAEVLSRTHGLPAVGLRYFNVVGPRQDPDGPYAAVVPRWVTALARGESPVIYGDGETSRDFCPVANVVQANLHAALSTDISNGRAYNVALGRQTTLNGLFLLLRAAMASRGFPCGDLEPRHEGFRDGDIRHSLADISAASRDLGYHPSVDLEQGLWRTIEDVGAGDQP